MNWDYIDELDNQEHLEKKRKQRQLESAIFLGEQDEYLTDEEQDDER